MAKRTSSQNRAADAPAESRRAQSASMVTGAPGASEPSEEDIRLRAYHRFLERGAGHGNDFDDWLEAEQELKKKS
jgi:hypothetical protein